MLSARLWKPLNPGYDFLQMIKEDDERKRERDMKMGMNTEEDSKRMERIRMANEHGVGE